MPDCYHIVSSDAESTASDIQSCVRRVGGPGRPHRYMTNRARDRVHSFVHYDTWELAEEYLDRLTKCFEERHTVEHAEVVADFEELGIRVQEEPPESGSETTVT